MINILLAPVRFVWDLFIGLVSLGTFLALVSLLSLSSGAVILGLVFATLDADASYLFVAGFGAIAGALTLGLAGGLSKILNGGY